MVWESVHWASSALAERACSLLHEVTETTAAAWNGTQPLLQAARDIVYDKLEHIQAYSVPRLLEFKLDAFQTGLLSAILIVLVGNILLILLAWSLYGERIVEHFTAKDGTDKIRDLGLRQNLPKEYTPKY